MKPSQWFHSKAMLSFVMSANILLAGCASTGSTYTDSSVPAADPRLTQGNDAKFFSKSGYQACAVAAGVGILGIGGRDIGALVSDHATGGGVIAHGPDQRSKSARFQLGANDSFRRPRLRPPRPDCPP